MKDTLMWNVEAEGRCKKLNNFLADELYCDSLKNLLVLNNEKRLNPPTVIQALFIANGLCRRLMEHIASNYYINKKHIGKYMVNHKPLTPLERIKLKTRLEGVTILENEETQLSEYMPSVTYRILKRINMDEETAFNLAYKYEKGFITIMDIANYILIFKEFYRKKFRKPKKDKFKSLTIEEGFNINVEELL